jgi:hypothetical protein
MTISGFSFTDPEFSQTSNCPSTLSAGAVCIVNLIF